MYTRLNDETYLDNPKKRELYLAIDIAKNAYQMYQSSYNTILDILEEYDLSDSLFATHILKKYIEKNEDYDIKNIVEEITED